MPVYVRDPALVLIEQRIFEGTYERDQLIFDSTQTSSYRAFFRTVFIKPFQSLFAHSRECFSSTSILGRLCRFCCKNCFGEITCVLVTLGAVIVLVALGKELASALINWVSSWLPSLNLFTLMKRLSNAFSPFF